MKTALKFSGLDEFPYIIPILRKVPFTEDLAADAAELEVSS